MYIVIKNKIIIIMAVNQIIKLFSLKVLINVDGVVEDDGVVDAIIIVTDF